MPVATQNTASAEYAKQLAEGTENPFNKANLVKTLANSGNRILHDLGNIKVFPNSYPWKDGSWEKQMFRHTIPKVGTGNTRRAAKERWLAVTDESRKQLHDLDQGEINGLHKALTTVYRPKAPRRQQLDWILIRNGVAAGQTIEHFHMHYGAIHPGRQTKLYCGIFAFYKERGHTSSKSDLIANDLDLKWIDLHQNDKEIYLAHVPDEFLEATSIESYALIGVKTDGVMRLNQLSAEQFGHVMYDVAIHSHTDEGNTLVYWEYNPDKPYGMDLLIHIIAVKPGECILVQGRIFPS